FNLNLKSCARIFLKATTPLRSDKPKLIGGQTLGRILTGLIGIILGLSLLSGVVALRKIRAQLFKLRLKRSVRLMWQDTHNTLSLWSLPFSAMIAVTGMFIGLVAIILPLQAVLSTKGDMALISQSLRPPITEPTGLSGPQLRLDQLLETGDIATPLRATFRNWGDEEALIEIAYPERSKLASERLLTRKGMTGEIVDNVRLGHDGSASGRTLLAFSALHFGTFQGVAVKLLYLPLGAILCIIIAFGNTMWIERRLHGKIGSRTPITYERMSRVNIGLCAGLPLATAMALQADMLIDMAPSLRQTVVGYIYFGSIISAIMYAFFPKNSYIAARHVLFVTGALCALLPLTNWAMTGDNFVSDLFGAAPAHAWADFCFLVIGIAMIIFALKLPMRRPLRKQEHADGDIGSASSSLQ
ncbi:MAG: PepSY-associated TM helix domain-containing protein, partial [Pseudomonadota bacterium]